MCNTFNTVLIITAAAWQKITGNKHLSSMSHGTSCCTGIGFSPDEDCRRNDADFTNPKEGCFFNDGRRLNGPLIFRYPSSDWFKTWNKYESTESWCLVVKARGKVPNVYFVKPAGACYFRKAVCACIVTDIFLFIFKFVCCVG